MRHHLHVLILLLLGSLLLITPSTVLALGYTFTTIDAPPHTPGAATYTVFIGINNAGQVVGEKYDFSPGNSGPSGFLFEKGAFTFGIGSAATGINEAGMIVGNGAWDGFLLNQDRLTIISIVGESSGNCVDTGVSGINNAGQIVGSFDFFQFAGSVPPYSKGFLYSGSLLSTTWCDTHSVGWVPVLDMSGFTAIHVPGAIETRAYGINDASQIVGTFWDVNGQHGFLLSEGRFTTIDVPGASRTLAHGINKTGQIVGYFNDIYGWHGFLLSEGRFTTIDVPGAIHTYALGINDVGQIVGQYNGFIPGSNNWVHGFLATPNRLQSICFLNDHKIRFDQPVITQPGGPYADNDSGPQCESPEWVKFDTGQVKTLPVAYVSGEEVKLRATLSLDPPLTQETRVVVTGMGPDGMVFRWSGTASGDSFETAEMSARLPHTGGVYNLMLIQWSVDLEGIGESHEESLHTLYRTLGPTPPPESINYLTLIDIAARAAHAFDRTDADTIVQRIWAQFRPRFPSIGPRVFPRGVRADGRVVSVMHPRTGSLRYYDFYDAAQDPLQEEIKELCIDAQELLFTGVGNCTAWARFFADILTIHGLENQLNIVRLRPLSTTSAHGFLVKDWLFIDPPSFPGDVYPYQIGETAIDLQGIPGAGNQNPPSQFGAHWITCYRQKDGTLIYLDPSYGTPRQGFGFSISNVGGTPKSPEYENASIDGFFQIWIDSNGRMVEKRARPQDTNVDELDYTYWPGNTQNLGCAREEPPALTSLHIVLPNATVSLQASVPPGSTEAIFSSRWLGSDVVMTLVSPTGRVIDRHTTGPGLIHDRSPTSEVYAIANPESGAWTIELFGADLPPQGEEVTVTVATTGQTDTTPPATTISIDPAPNAAGWNNTSVTVTLTTIDNPGGSGVKEISVSFSGAQVGGNVMAGSRGVVTVFAEGTTTLSYFARDNAGNQEVPKTLTVHIDKTPPVIAGLPAPDCTLWPPNHRLVQVATVTASDGLSGLALGSPVVTGTSSEPEDGLGDGDLASDIIIASGTVQLRAERSGTGTGRSYTLTSTAGDLAGNSATMTATCTVPHDQRK